MDDPPLTPWHLTSPEDAATRESPLDEVGLGWIAPIYRVCATVAHMGPREVDELYPWEVAAILGVDTPDHENAVTLDDERGGLDISALPGMGLMPEGLVMKGAG